MSANADSQTDSRLDADWPSVGSRSVTTGSNTLSLGSDGVTTDSTALPHPSDSEFLVGGAHLLPSNLRDVPLPRVASLSEGVRQVWAGQFDPIIHRRAVANLVTRWLDVAKFTDV